VDWLPSDLSQLEWSSLLTSPASHEQDATQQSDVSVTELLGDNQVRIFKFWPWRDGGAVYWSSSTPSEKMILGSNLSRV
jgi:hypothetical protein